MQNKNLIHLNNRCLVSVTGDDACDFLQGLITNDMKAVSAEEILYACLLTAQGQFLYDFFVLPRDEGGYYLDCETLHANKLIQRLSMYKLRAKVELGREDNWFVYAGKAGDVAFQDPRWPDLGVRSYTRDSVESAGTLDVYEELCISFGVPPDSAAVSVSKDFLSDVNLDLLQAVNWDKGCFIGQELTARIHHRGLVKRRLLCVEGSGLAVGDKVLQGSVAMGEVRAVNHAGNKALARLKLSIFDESGVSLSVMDKGTVSVSRPPCVL